MRSTFAVTLTSVAVLTALGSASASVSCASGGAVPLVTSSGVTGVTTSAATLHADVNPSGCATQYRFEYGTTAAYGDATVTQGAGSGTAAKAVAARIVGLAASTPYHFRIVATNSAGTTDGPDQTFQTLLNCASGGSRPSITHTTVTVVTEFAAKLHATVNPNGCATSYQFAYGQTTHYEHRTPTVHVTSGTAPIPASQAIRGLSPNTKYHFRFFTYSASGNAVGPDRTFRTKLAGVAQIAPGPAYLDKPFVAGIRLSCVHGSAGCAGAVKIFSAHRLIGRHRFFLRRGRTGTILVGLDSLGRTLFHARPALHVEVVAQLRYYKTTRFLMLVRRFTLRTR